MISEERINALIDRLVALGLIELIDEPTSDDCDDTL